MGSKFISAVRAMGAVMVAKGRNSSGCSSFRPLKGRLFRLENDLTFRSSHVTTAERFWLSHCCSSTMTLHLAGDGSVIPAVRVHLPIRSDSTMKPPHTIPPPLRTTDQTEPTFQSNSR